MNYLATNLGNSKTAAWTGLNTNHCHFSFILYSLKYTHKDLRISYPLCLIFYSPRDSKTELMVMYAHSKLEVVKRADVNKEYEIDDLEELSFELIQNKLDK